MDDLDKNDHKGARGCAFSQLGRHYLRRDDTIEVHGVKLPHWNQEDIYVFLNFRLGDSLPQQKLNQLKSERNIWMLSHPQPWSQQTENEFHRKFSHRIEQWVDKGYGCCFFRNSFPTSILVATMLHDDGIKYELVAYVVMPNHVHALVRMFENIRVETLMQEWKSISSHKLKKQFGSEWCDWMENYFDRAIRDENHLNNVISYIYKNYCRGGIQIGGSVFECPTRH